MPKIPYIYVENFLIGSKRPFLSRIVIHKKIEKNEDFSKN